jgi:hypothetical protein
MRNRRFLVAAFIAFVGSSLACKRGDDAGASAAASSSAVTPTTTTSPPSAALASASSAPAASVASAAPSASAAKPALTATPGVRWDPHGYPGGFAAECDHKLNKVTKQPEEYPNAPSCETKWAPSCEAVLKCIKGDPAFK